MQDKIKQKIISLVPEIMNLEFGCEVLVGEYNDSYDQREAKHVVFSVEINPNNSRVPRSFETCCGKYTPTSAADGHLGERKRELGYWSILGRKITLADVLRAIGKHFEEADESWEYAIDSLGRFMRDWGEGRHETVSENWNLALDSYDLQSQETKDFIGTLLGITK